MSILPVFILLLILSYRLCTTISDVGLHTDQMIKNHGYVCENHKITTQDGYILTYQRIPHGLSDNGPDKKPAVLLMHGLFSSSAEYIVMGSKNGIGYILADLGYDVWLGNARGTKGCRKHKTLQLPADKEQFFDFSWHEIGYYDLPAAIDHILNVTQRRSLYYIGHSQGGTIFVVFASTRPEYAKKIKLASLVAPATFMDHYDNKIVKPLAERVYDFEKLIKNSAIYEFPLVRDLQELTSICGNQFTPEMLERLPVIMSHFPSPVSIKQILHYGQSVRNGGFRQYDYGVRKNLQIYGFDTPPSYNLSAISIRVAVFYSKGDRQVNFKDVKILIKRLPNVVYEYFGPPTLGHLEFLFAREVIDPVDGKLIKVIENY